MRSVTACAVVSVLVGWFSVPSVAQVAVSNARQDTMALRGGLTATLATLTAEADEPRWIAWQEAASGRLDTCCWDDAGRGCRLEPPAAGAAARPSVEPVPSTVMLEGDRTLTVLVRLANRRIERLRTVGASCALDAGGLRFTIVDQVPVAESVAWLRSLVDVPNGAAPDEKLSRHLRDGAIHAIGRHADASAVPVLLELARRHAQSAVRGTALVALAQTAGRTVAPEIVGAVRDDPDVAVKRRAVFALSQLPKDEGVPLLIDVAREHKETAVRRQAMFWLGQSRDPRAVEFFAALLGK